MTLTEQIYAQALMLIQDSQNENPGMLEILCRCSENALRQKLRDGVTPDDCKADFVAAASLFALAALSEMDEAAQIEQFRAGDLTLRRNSSNSAACCLRHQAEAIMQPYVKDKFSFVGV